MPGRLLLLSQAPSFSLTSPLCSLDCFSRLLCLHMLFLHVFTLFLVHFTTLSTWWTPLIFKVELKPHSFCEASSALLIFLVSIAPSAYLHCFLTLNDVVQFSCSVVSNSLRPHGLQHARPPCPSPTPRVYSNSCPSSQWCHPTISSFRLFLLPPSTFPSIGVFSNEFSSLHQVAKVLKFQLQHQSFQWIFRTDFL